jgi:hypothetical protein
MISKTVTPDRSKIIIEHEDHINAFAPKGLLGRISGMQCFFNHGVLCMLPTLPPCVGVVFHR